MELVRAARIIEDYRLALDSLFLEMEPVIPLSALPHPKARIKAAYRYLARLPHKPILSGFRCDRLIDEYSKLAYFLEDYKAAEVKSDLLKLKATFGDQEDLCLLELSARIHAEVDEERLVLAQEAQSWLDEAAENGTQSRQDADG